MKSENTCINSKASVVCDNVEGNLISVRLKGLQSLVECCKNHSNGRLLNYLTEQDSNNMPNKVFVDKGCRCDYTNSLREITETRQQKCDNVTNRKY